MPGTGQHEMEINTIGHHPQYVPSVYLMSLQVTKSPWSFPSVFALLQAIKDFGLETRLTILSCT